MANLQSDFVGIKSPNPFWLASAPPTDKAYNVRRAFDAGWGGVVWKTVGEEGPPLPPNLIVPVPLSPALSIIRVVASKSNVPAFISMEDPET